MGAKVSVCLPVFNGEKYLSRAIESVLSQTFTDLELLISDDCSQDSSVEIIKQYAAKDSRIKFWINSKNAGLFQNYNICFERSSAEVIKPFAQDDLLHPRMLERMMEVIISRPSVVLVSAARDWIDEDGTDISCKIETPSAGDMLPANCKVPGLDVIHKSLGPVINFIGEPSTVAFRKAATVVGFDATFHQLGDLEYWLRILRNGDYFFIDDVLCSFRHHSHSRSSSNAKGLMFAPDVLRMGRKFKDILEAAGCTEETFLLGAIESLAGYVRTQTTQQALSLDHLRSKEDYLALTLGNHALNDLPRSALERLVADLLDFREIAVHALSIDWWRKLDDDARAAAAAAVNRETVAQNLKLIDSLESGLQALLSSKSWHLTKSAREINALVSGNTTEPLLEKSTFPGRKVKKLDEHTEYIRYLRRQTRRVLRSRSWSLTRPLRRLGMDTALPEANGQAEPASKPGTGKRLKPEPDFG